MSAIELTGAEEVSLSDSELAELPSHYQAALHFMRHKGYDRAPDEVERETSSPFAWIFVYHLPEGKLDLLVEWLVGEGRWEVAVDDFVVPS